MQKGKFNNSRGFGVEIEYIRPTSVSKQEICNALTSVTCRVEGYNHNTVSYWKIVTDASVKANPSCTYASDSYNGYVGDNEIVSPILYGENGFEQLKEILDVLNNKGCKVNYSCGIHVHHDVTNKMIEGKEKSQKFLTNLIKFVAKYEHLIYKLVSPSRLDSRKYSTPVRRDYFDRYCNMNKRQIKEMMTKVKRDCTRKYRNGSDIDRGQISPRVQSNRGCGLNLRNVWTRGSVEFRYHNGSLNFDKIVSWIVFTQAIVNTVEEANSVQMNYVPSDVDGLFYLRKAIGFVGSTTRDAVTDMATNYIVKRYKELSARENDYRRQGDYTYVDSGLTLNQEGV
ncbi:MAG: putative amidoligase enzyme [Prokaryotic dsDNA virus sp.]|nr:MAG: putative amidoligase enzyme [Prokaryotic dsDNA virus sp.]